MKRAAVLCTIFDVILFVFGEKRSQPVLRLTLLRKEVPAEILHCYHCVQNHHGCFSLFNISQVPVKFCNLDQPHCMVEKRLETGGKVTEFSRGCAERCVPGCQWGMTHIRCTSCCNVSLCNTDNRATGGPRGPGATLTAVVAAAALLLCERSLTPWGFGGLLAI